MVVAAEALWVMLYADNAGIVSRSPQSLEKMMSIIVRAAGLFGLMVSEPKTETTYVLAAERDGGALVHGKRRRPDGSANGSVRLPWTDHHRGREGG